MRGRMVKKSWHDSYHFKIVSQKCLKTAKFHQSEFRFQIHYGILDSTKTILVQGNTVITRSVSSLEFFLGGRVVEDRHKASSSSSSRPLYCTDNFINGCERMQLEYCTQNSIPSKLNGVTKLKSHFSTKITPKVSTEVATIK